MMGTTRKRIIYWIATGLVAFSLLSGGIAEFMRLPANVAGLAALGYPIYLNTILGVWKVLGVIVILSPGLPRLKEWAYAGTFFDFSGAAISHAVCHEPGHIIAPAILVVLALISWYLRPPGRVLGKIA